MVNGALVCEPEGRVEPEGLLLTVQGEPVFWKQYRYLMLNKPMGVLTATEDHRQKTVLDLLPNELRRQGVAPVGRLDKDTEGLLLLTNDGGLAHRLLSPRYHIKKCYFVGIDGIVDQQDMEAFQAGLVLGDGTQCLPAELEPLEPGQCLVILREGKYHQVKRMLAACGKPVKALKRISMGPLQLDDALEAGHWRELTEAEIRALREAGSRDEKEQI